MIKLKSLLVESINDKKIYKNITSSGDTWIVLISPAIQNSPDNPNGWKYRATIFKKENNELIPQDHTYLDSNNDETCISTINRNWEWFITPWKKQ